MIGAVVRLEWLLRGRRDQFRPLLSCYAMCLFLDCNALYVRVICNRDCIFLPPLPGQSGRFLAAAVEFLWLQQWLVAFLLAPPFVASAFAREKASGMLSLLFTTPLTSGEIILGKFLGRVFPLVLLAIAHWPFWGLLVGLLGLDPLSAAVLAWASLLPMLAVSAAGLLASVWCRRTADAVVAPYAVFGAGILGIWSLEAAVASFGPERTWLVSLANGLEPFHPFYLLEPIWDGRAGLPELGRRALIAIAAWGSVVAGCLGFACWRLRPAATDRPEIRRSSLSSRRPAVDDEPLRWKECYRERRMPLVFFRHVPTWLALLAVFVGTACVFLWSVLPSGTSFTELRPGDFEALASHLRSNAQPGGPGLRECLALVTGLGMLLLAAVTVGVRSATAISGERERRTWEALLLTPLSTRELIHGKVQGILRSARPYLAVYALATVPLACLAGQGVLLATLVTLLLAGPILGVAGAVGIHRSARAANSWRSILDTVGFLIGATLLTVVVSNFVLGFLGLVVLGLGNLVEILAIDLPFLDWVGVEPPYQRWFCFLLGLGSLWTVLCWQASREDLAKTEQWVDDFERTPRPEIREERGPGAVPSEDRKLVDDFERTPRSGSTPAAQQGGRE